MGVEAVEFAVRFAAAGTGNRNLPVLPPVQAAASAEPDAAIPVGQNGPYGVIRQPLLDSKRGDGEVAKAVEAIIGSDPDSTFPILKECVNVFARKAVSRSKPV